jgi:hypothetical protein
MCQPAIGGLVHNSFKEGNIVKILGIALGAAAVLGVAATTVNAAQVIITGTVVATPDSEVFDSNTFSFVFVPTPGPSYGPFTGVQVGDSFTYTIDVDDATQVTDLLGVGPFITNGATTFEVGGGTATGVANSFIFSYLGTFGFPASADNNGTVFLSPAGYNVTGIAVDLPVITTDTPLTALAGSYAQNFEFEIQTAPAGFGTPPERLTFLATNAVVTPEPASLALLGLGGLALIRRR